MSVFGSLFTAVSGLEAQSSSIAMISNNIANVNTTGYKRTDAKFSSLVTSSGRSTAYSPGSVRSIQSAQVTEQGILQQTSSETDIAISGNGFFVVNSDDRGANEPLYTRAGSFSEDSSGVLINASGFYLMGWLLDQDGNLPASQADISSMSVVDVSFLGGLTLPTTTASIAMNLQADEDNSPYATAVAPGFNADFSRSIKVYDSLGEGHDLSVNFKKMESPTAIAKGNGIDLNELAGPMVNDPAFTAGTNESFSITVGAHPPYTVVITDSVSVSDMISLINNNVNDAGGDSVAYALVDPDTGELVIKARNPEENVVIADVVGDPSTQLNIAGTATAPVTAANLDMLAAADPNNLYNTEGWWQVEFRISGTNTVIESGALNFIGDGSLNAIADPISGQVLTTLQDIDWSNGSDPQDINFDVAGFSNFSGQYNVISSEQNGAELGLRTGVAIDEEGFVIAQFSNGQSKQIYKLAIATFANENGLTEISGNVFRESDTSGSFNLREAGSGSAGKVNSGALEASNVDLADEFSKMIVTQRAYSANTKVISTADTMLEELLRLR